MTDVTSDTEAGKAPVGRTSAADDGLVAELVARAQAGGVKLLVVQAILFVNPSTRSFITCADQLTDSTIKLAASIIDAGPV